MKEEVTFIVDFYFVSMTEKQLSRNEIYELLIAGYVEFSFMYEILWMILEDFIYFIKITNIISFHWIPWFALKF